MRGQKTGGGSRKGIPNKVTAAREAELSAAGLMPLAYMLKVLRNEDESAGRRDWAAEKAAPFCHPRLAQIDARAALELRQTNTSVHILDARHLNPDQRQALLTMINLASDESITDASFTVVDDTER